MNNKNVSSILLIFYFLTVGLLTQILSSKIVHAAERTSVEYKHSEISFTGDDSFVTGRYTWEPLPSDRLWVERITFSGGIMSYRELQPGYYYTGQNEGIHTFRDTFNRNSNFKRRSMSITLKDIQEFSNENGDYFLAIQENSSSFCGMAKQFTGSTNAEGILAVGTKVATAYFCRKKSRIDRANLIAKIRDIMDRARYDEGKLNKQRAATK